MLSFLLYESKVALSLLVLYLPFRFFLKKETFHRFNRVVLVGTAILSFLIPLCIITIHKPMVAPPVVEPSIIPALPNQDSAVLEQASEPWWPKALAMIFLTGASSVLLRLLISTLSIIKLIRQGECVREEDGFRIIVSNRDIAPLSWMNCIVLSRDDWEASNEYILTHEKAHIRFNHSVELLLVDMMSVLQWFNPVIWMLRVDLQEIHEYEADNAVLLSGANRNEYQTIIMRRAVGKKGYSVASSFNHSILRSRITMMHQSKSPVIRKLRVLYLLPLVCLGISLQARTVYVQSGREGVFIEEKSEAILQEIVVVRYDERSASHEEIRHGANLEPVLATDALDVDTMPYCTEYFAFWLNERLLYPKECMYEGTVWVRFTVGTDGQVSDIKVIHSICEELDDIVVKLISKSPTWVPAKKEGNPVAVQLIQPIEFHIRTIG